MRVDDNLDPLLLRRDDPLPLPDGEITEGCHRALARDRACVPTPPRPLTTFDAVARETPASLATSVSVVRWPAVAGFPSMTCGAS